MEQKNEDISSVEEGFDVSTIKSDNCQNDKNGMYLFNIYLEMIDKILSHEYKEGYYYNKLFRLIEKKDIDEFYFCNKCEKSFIFYIKPENIVSLDSIEYSCECNKSNKKISIDKLKDIKTKIVIKDNENLPFVCKICKEKFHFFCTNHKESICINFHVDIPHKSNDLTKFDKTSIYSYLKYLANFTIEVKNNTKQNDSKYQNANYLRNLISTTIINYIIYPNYNLYLTIKNLSDAFGEYSRTKHSKNEDLYFIKFLEINNNKRQFIQLTDDLYPLVQKIELRQKKIYDEEENDNQNLFKKINNFENLIELNLEQNCIYSIKSFKDAKFKNLEILNLSINLLNDENIKHIENLCCENLFSLNLEENLFTKYELLVAIGKKFKKLNILKIGNNTFKVKNKKGKINEGKTLKEIVDELKKLSFSNLKEFYANNGAFSQNAANKIFKVLKLDTFCKIDLRNNQLNNLDFAIKYMNKQNEDYFFEGNEISEEKKNKYRDSYIK